MTAWANSISPGIKMQFEVEYFHALKPNMAIIQGYAEYRNELGKTVDQLE